MEVGDTVDVGDLVAVATAVTGWVLVVDLGGGVQRLVDVTDVVDDETESERLSVLGVGVKVKNGNDVVRVLGAWDVLEVVGESSESLNDVGGGHHVLGVAGDGVTLTEVRLVNEMPVRLPGEAKSLDVVGERGALGEGVVLLVLSHARVVGLENFEAVHSPVVGTGVLGGEESLSLASNCVNKSTIKMTDYLSFHLQ